VSTGCPILDAALGGGLRRGAVTELAGEAGSGKTQLCLQFALSAARAGSQAVWVDTEGFPHRRLDQLVVALARPELRDLLLVQQVRDIDHLLTVLGAQLTGVAPTAALLVVDSVAALVRYTQHGDTGLARAGAVHKIGQRLAAVALEHGLAVLAVNQAVDLVEGGARTGYSWGRGTGPSLGLAWTHYPNTRLWLARTKQAVPLPPAGNLVRLRRLQVDWSCRLPAGPVAQFVVTESGVRGVRITD